MQYFRIESLRRGLQGVKEKISKNRLFYPLRQLCVTTKTHSDFCAIFPFLEYCGVRIGWGLLIKSIKYNAFPILIS